MSSGESVTRWLDGVKAGGKEPTPDDAGRFADALDHLIDRLQDPILKTIALRKLDGQSAEEIGAFLGTSTRTIDRKLRLIRTLWEETAA